ncbi:hypothetical protein RD792_017287 [Penstemon davidsonii]|uniref:protein-tyrosine-phosphatase n=1 Tax=Penstemon davidsonii TaxID=160366 RepID=A0ABR0CMD0_9LAMI|nr:hypothetical protein RD792_017287 [Penstemon davidsonii]
MITVLLLRSDVNLLPFFDECFAFIDEARTTGGAVLVHCFAGRSRSVTIIVAYLMFKNGMSLSEAMEHVKGKRPVVSPNSGFMLQLADYERYLRGNSFIYFSRIIDISIIRLFLGLFAK